MIGGRLRRVRLIAPRGLEVRPTSDLLRQRVFDVLGPLIEGADIWDACAGTGAVGLEAYSRGARFTLFSEPLKRALQALEKNVARCALPRAAHEIWPVTWQRAAGRLARQGRRFGLVYFDPPYAEADYACFLETVNARRLLSDEGLAVIEHRPRAELPVNPRGLERFRELGTRSSRVSLFRLAPDPSVG